MNNNHVPYFRFYPSDFMAGVRGMTAQEVGVYTMLLCLIYEASGPVENNPLRLATYCGMRQPTFEKTCEKLVALGKIVVADGCLTNARAEAEIAKRSDDLKNSSKAGKASAEKRQQKQQNPSTPVQQSFNHTDTDTDTVTEANASVPAQRAKRGSRLPEAWTLPKDWGEWAMSEGWPETVIRAEADKFKDYWIARAGKDATKADWLATWRNWMRNSKTTQKGNQNERRAFDQATAAVAVGLTSGAITLDHSSRDPFAVRPRRDPQADEHGAIPLFRS